MQGSGTFGVESVISSLIPVDNCTNKLLVISNGKYGDRILKISEKNKVNSVCYKSEPNIELNYKDIEDIICNNNNIKYVAMVHHETSTGQINNINNIGHICKKYNKIFIVDAMSSFGGTRIDLVEDNIDFLISSPNKCLESVPGFSYIIFNTNLLKNIKNSNTLVLDLYDQYNYMLETGQFRFTPPIQSIMAFNHALSNYINEGGIISRIKKYKKLNDVLVALMTSEGFICPISKEYRGKFITLFDYSNHENLIFDDLYDYLQKKSYIIYPGNNVQKTFRIGNIGHLKEEHIKNLVKYIKEYLIIVQN